MNGLLWLAKGLFPKRVFHPDPCEKDSFCSNCKARERFLWPYQDVSSSAPNALKAMLVKNFIYAEEEERLTCGVWPVHGLPGLEGHHGQEVEMVRAVPALLVHS